MTSFDPHPFTVDVPDADLEDLRRRLATTRFPDELTGEEWVYGTAVADLRAIIEFWANDYDWRAAEQSLNERPQFIVTIDGERVHYRHVRSSRPDATPLLLTHGWPGSIVEFDDLIDPLSEPEDPATPAFHLVIPSLPGFGLSGQTVTTGVSPQRIARMWAELMAGLGYDRYIAQGGDWGAIITSWIGAEDADHCAGIHLNMVVAPPSDEMLDDATAEEQAIFAELKHFQTEERGYSSIQGTKPQTLAFALSDSPAGLCAWVLEKFRTWSDCDGDVFAVHDRNRFCTNLMLYWLTNTAGSASRIYFEHLHSTGGPTPQRVDVPMGGAIFPKEIYKASRRWAEARFRVVHWSEFDRGGHFAALERPDDLIGEIRAFAENPAVTDAGSMVSGDANDSGS